VSLRLRRIAIDRFGPLRDFVLEPDALTVIEAGNEGGKSSIVDALDAWLRQFRRANTTVWGGRVGRPGFDEGSVEVDLAGGEMPDVLRDNPILLNLLVIPEGRASVRESGSSRHDWLEEAKQHLSGFDPDPLRKRLRARAGLTPTERDTRDWTRRSEELAATARGAGELLASVDALAEREAELRAVVARRTAVESEIELERRAVDHRSYRRANDALETLERARESLRGLERFREEDLESWRGLDRERERALGEENAARAALEALGSDRDEAAARAREAERLRDEARDRAAALAAAALGPHAESAARELRATRELHESSCRMRWLWILACLAGAAGGTAGLLLDRPDVAASTMTLVVIGGALWARSAVHGRRYRRAAAVGEALVAEARRLGIDADSAEAIVVEADAVERDALREEERLAAARNAVDALETRLARQRAVLGEAEGALGRIDRRLGELRDRSGLPTLEELDRRVRERREQQRRRDGAERTLGELLPDTAPSRYREAVDRLRSDDPGRAPTAGLLQRLDDRLGRLRIEERRLEAETRGALRDGLLRLGLPDLAAAREALERARDEQRELVRAREAARLVLRAIADAEQDVERHLDRALESADGGAGSYFRELTGGRWQGVRRDGERLLATGPRGVEVGVESLSRGTRDQLHFALRVALAERILGSPGFFVWDDTFLTADLERRRRMVTAAVGLAARGWQVIYLTVDGAIAAMFEDEVSRQGVCGFRRVRLPGSEDRAAAEPGAATS